MAADLRVYLGAAPGVGKTYAMLDEVRRRAGRGARVVVMADGGHGRSATAALLASIDARVLPADAPAAEVLALAPDIVAVDDLATGDRAALVGALLAAGTNVVTTIDIGELESQRDLVERITGRAPAGTVPDAFLRDAAVELVDMTPEALRRRLAHGNVFPPGELDAVTANLFRPANLAAVRELALRWVADHAGGTGAGSTVAVAITGGPAGEALIRGAGRIAARSHAALVGIHVRSRRPAPADVLESTRRLVEDLGGVYREVAATDVAAALVDAARAERATQLVLGASRRSRLREAVAGSVITDVIRHAGDDLDVHVIGSRSAAGIVAGTRSASDVLVRRRRVAGWAIVAGGLPGLTVVLTALHPEVHLSVALLLYLLVVTAGAAIGGTWPAAAGAVGAFLLANWYFIPPVHHWEIDNAEDVVALLAFAVVASVVAGLVVRSAGRQVEAARARAEARMLAGLSGASVADDPLLDLLVRLRDSFGLSGAAVVRLDDGFVEGHVGEVPNRAEAELVMAVGASHELIAGGRAISAEDRGIAAVVADHLTAALRTRRLGEAASTAAALAEGNELRTAILAAVSHDLRTPLSSIKASVTSLLQDDVDWPVEAVAEFLATIDEETDRLDDLVGNLLDLSRLQTNTLQILERDVGLEEVAPAAVASLGARARQVDLDVPETLPRVRVDAGLLERALANLVANAVTWSPQGGRVRVDASPVGDRIDIRVVDHGPGIPVDARRRVFEPFQRLGDRGGDGVGLGLAVARGFVTAMGGELLVEDTPGGGTTMVVSFPAAAR